MNYFKIGKIIKPHGINGYLKVDMDKEFVKFLGRKNLFINKDEFKKIVLESYKISNKFILIKFENINSIDQAEEYRSIYIYIDKDELDTLSEGSFYYYELIDCEVYYGDEFLGIVSNVTNYGSSDILFLETKNGKEILIPFIKKVIKKVSIKDNKISINKIEGII